MAVLNVKYEPIRNWAEALRHYVEFGTNVGDVLRAALNNDLRGLHLATVGSCSAVVVRLLVEFCENNLPDPAWGCVAAVDDWLSMSQEERHEIVTKSRWYRAAEILRDTQAKQAELADQET